MRRTIFSYFLISALGFFGWAGTAVSSHAQGTEMALASPNKVDSSFIVNYSKILGFKLDTACNQKLIAKVTEWLGTPYRTAGVSKYGADCSGFVSQLYKEVYNVELAHNANGMLFEMKQMVRRPELREGDIIFFRIHGRRISHVGIYLGDNKFVHASSSRGIVINDLTDPYYQRAYYTAGRPRNLQTNP